MSSVLNKEVIEVIDLDDSENESSEPPNKMVRLSQSSSLGSGLTFMSLPSPPRSPLTSNLTLVGKSGKNSDDLNNLCLNISENNKNSVNIDENKGNRELSETEVSAHNQTLKESESSHQTISVNTIHTKHCIKTEVSSDEHNIPSDNLAPNLNPIEDNSNENKEVLIKRLIGICFDNYCQKQMKSVDIEDNISELIQTLKTDSENRNQLLKNLVDIKCENKETQINGHKNDSNSDEYSLKVKTLDDNNSESKEQNHSIVMKTSTQEESDSILKKQLTKEEKQSILKKQLTSLLKTDNCLSNQSKPKNGFNKEVPNICLPNSSNDNTFVNKFSTDSSDNSGDNVCNGSDDPEVVVIESDDDVDDNVSTATMETLIPKKQSKQIPFEYKVSLPTPKLSLSYKLNDDNSNANGFKGSQRKS